MAITPKLGTAELLYHCAGQMGLQPSWVIPGGVFVIAVEGREIHINLARSPLNSDLGASLAKDKYLARLILGRHKLQNIPFARPATLLEAEVFLARYGKIIAKPVTGAGAQDVHIITSAAQLRNLSIAKYILEQYIAGPEMRYLVLGQEVIAVHQSEYGTSVEATRALRRISYHESEWDTGLVGMSLRIARILGLEFAAVDYLIDDSGRPYILEVNTMPGLKWFHAPSSGPAVDVARMFLTAILDQQPRRQRKKNISETRYMKAGIV